MDSKDEIKASLKGTFDWRRCFPKDQVIDWIIEGDATNLAKVKKCKQMMDTALAEAITKVDDATDANMGKVLAGIKPPEIDKAAL